VQYLTRFRRGWVFSSVLCYFLIALLFVVVQSTLTKAQSVSFNRATYSSPIALSANNQLVWSVNPDDDSVSVIRTDTNSLITNIKVGNDPESVAVDPNNQYAYVANAADNSVTVIKILNSDPNNFSASIDPTVGRNGSWKTGAEPFDLVISPDGKRLFVANSNQDTITVINAENRSVIGNINLHNSPCNVDDPNRSFQPRGLGVTQDSRYLYVARFLSFTKPGGTQGDDNGKEGVVCRVEINTGTTNIGDYAPTAPIRLASQKTGFLDTNKAETSAFPNQLQSIVIRGNHAYLPNIAASPTRPLRFDVDTHAFVNRIDGLGGSETDAGALNLHLGARDPEPGKKKLFFANQWGIAFTNQSGAGNAYALSAGSDLLIKLNVDAAGALAFTVDDDTTRYIDLNDPANAATSGANAGKNPVGIVITDDGKTAYTNNFVSRNISVVDLTTDAVAKVIQTTTLPTPGSSEEVLQAGAEVFFSSRGNFVRPPGTTVSTSERLSQGGWQNCASCHFKGWTDGVIWQFATGPRKSVPLNATFNPNDPNDQRILNYSGIFDEVQDFENNIRNVSGPGTLALQGLPPVDCAAVTPVAGSPTNLDPNHGLLFADDGDINKPPCEQNSFLTLANANRSQHRIQLPGSFAPINALDAVKEWVRFSVRTPNRPLTQVELVAGRGNPVGGLKVPEVIAGRKLFKDANCQACHVAGKWTVSGKDFVSPPNPADVVNEAGAAGTNQAQFLFRFLRDINSFNLNVPGQGNAIAGQPQIGAVEVDTAGNKALGFDHNGDGKGTGYNVPSLLGEKLLPPYYHNGACETLDCVVADVKHRTAGLTSGQPDPLAAPEDQKKLVSFLSAIDAETNPIQP
jgi:YVTN family beta-propeller protein